MAKVAIVTGSATGLGAACAVDLAGRGWNVAINYTKSKKEADETYEKVKAKGVEAILVQADMGQDADCRKLAAETMKAWGRIDGLINNAGTTKFQSQGDLDGVSAEDFDRILRVNVTGPYMMSRAVYPTMKKQWDDKQERGFRRLLLEQKPAGSGRAHKPQLTRASDGGCREPAKGFSWAPPGVGRGRRPRRRRPRLRPGRP